MVIYPEDWKIVTVKEVADINTGRRNTQDNKPNGRYKFFVRSQTVERIDVADYDCEAVLTAGDGNAGKVFHYVNGKFSAHQRVYIINNFRNISGRFFYYYFSRYFIDEVRKYTAKSTVDSVRRPMIADMLIPLPPLHEQQAIADTLATFDTHIANLTELITKKKAIRDGALEDLMSGRTRIEGFCGDWEVKTLGEIATYRKERVIVPKKLYVSTENMMQNFGGIEHYRDKDFIAGISFNCGNVLIANIRPYLKKVYFADFCGSCSPDVLVLEANEDVCAKFLYYCVANDIFTNYVMKGGVKGTKMLRGDKQYIMQYIISLPTLQEQIAIANTLTALDKEISSLENERAKISQIRNGAINDLLSGKVRLSHGIRKTTTEPRQTLAD